MVRTRALGRTCCILAVALASLASAGATAGEHERKLCAQASAMGVSSIEPLQDRMWESMKSGMGESLRTPRGIRFAECMTDDLVAVEMLQSLKRACRTTLRDGYETAGEWAVRIGDDLFERCWRRSE